MRDVLPCRQLILYRFLGFLGIHYHQFQCRQKAKTDKAQISLNYFTSHIKKVIYVFHGNWDSFDMIFITVIQPKIHKSNGLLKRRISDMFPSCFYFNLFFNRVLNRGWLVYMFSLRFSGRKFLINVGRQFRGRKFFSWT